MKKSNILILIAAIVFVVVMFHLGFFIKPQNGSSTKQADILDGLVVNSVFVHPGGEVSFDATNDGYFVSVTLFPKSNGVRSNAPPSRSFWGKLAKGTRLKIETYEEK